MELSALVTKVNALGCLFRGLTLAIGIVPASLVGTALAVNVNQHGLTGAWHNPAISGQGIQIEIYQDMIAPGIGYLYGEWATFAVGWENGQRWYSFGGTVQTGKTSSTLEILQTTGGNFNDPATPLTVPVGTMVLTFNDCNTAVMEYQDLRLDVLGDFYWGPFYGTIPLERLIPNISCSVDAAPPPDGDFSYSGNWFDPATPGQGLFVELNRIAEASFVVWYTYDAHGALQGVEGLRWYTAQGNFVSGAFTLPMTLYETTDGVIGGSPDPIFTPKTQVVGTATMSFVDCYTAQWTFKFTQGSNAGASGTINLSRVGPAPEGCAP